MSVFIDLRTKVSLLMISILTIVT